jgi:hypothetical protein
MFHPIYLGLFAGVEVWALEMSAGKQQILCTAKIAPMGSLWLSSSRKHRHIGRHLP